MPQDNNYNSEIAGIRRSMETLVKASMKTALHVERISTQQEIYITQVTACSNETKQNTNDIIELSTKYNGHERFHKTIKQAKEGAIIKGRWCADSIRSWIAVGISAVIAAMFFLLKFGNKPGGS